MTTDSDRPTTRRARRRRALVAAGLATVVAEAVVLRVRTGRWAGHVAVRCRGGHVFRTLWIPGVSLTSLRLGWWRLHRCPVGHHWSLVTPVGDAALP